MAIAKTETAEIKVQPLKRASAKLRIIGQTPLFQNRMAAKATQQLLVGGRKKTKADRVEIKHQPLEEYRNSAEILPDGPTALGLRVIAVKAAMATAALETAGHGKADKARRIMAGRGLVGSGKAGEDRLGKARRGPAWFGAAWLTWCGLDRRGWDGRGVARRARLGVAGHG